MRLAVIILNYRTVDLTEACVASLSGQVRPDCDHVYVVDNGSADGSAERLARTFSTRGWADWVDVVPMARNDGFAAGNNQILSRLPATFYLLLNSDTVVRPGAVDALLTAAERRPDAGIVGPRMEAADGLPQASCFRFPSSRAELLIAADLGPLTRRFARHLVWRPVPNSPVDVDWVTFAAALIRGQVVESVGPLDDGYFMYYEDVDFCRRAGVAGWRIVYRPEARVAHLTAGPVAATAAARDRLPRYYYASRARYFAKARGRTGLWFANLCWLAGRTLSWTREVLQRRDSHLPAQAARDIWTNWRRPLQSPECRPA